MLYGTGYWGVTEANYLVVAGHFLSAIVGAQLWKGEYGRIFGWELPGGLVLRRGDLNLILVTYGGIHQSLGCIVRTLRGEVRTLARVFLSSSSPKQLGLGAMEKTPWKCTVLVDHSLMSNNILCRFKDLSHC